MKHHKFKPLGRQTGAFFGVKQASPELIEAALRHSPMLRELLDEAVSCAQIEYDQEQYRLNKSMGNPATL